MDRSQINQLRAQISACYLADRRRLQARLDQLLSPARASAAADSLWAALVKDIAASVLKVQQRRAGLPRPSYPEELPISQRRGDIADALTQHQVIIVCGETGSGKTTQLPKICLESGRGILGMVGHTQPRRIAARSLAARVAEELNTPLGQQVGYKVRFNDHVGANTYVKVMTDGILLAEIQNDRLLEHYDTLIIDEAHERSLNIDFMLGYLKQLLPKRPDLKLIITSATIDPERFAKHFNNAPIIEVSGRTFPVELRYRPSDDDERTPSMQQAILAAVDELAALGRGDILVFLSGEREIRETAEALRKHHPADTEVLPLYARLALHEQARVFSPHGKRRIVLATNVAETSLTVPGIHYVIDTGYARLSRYSYRSKVQRLPIEKISQASANQRSGRCGRIAAGVCIRLYDPQEFSLRPRYTEPEILRTNLASVILQMKAWRLGEPETFAFIDAPDPRLLKDGYQTLFEIGAINDSHKITALGRKLAKLPLDPRLARMLLAAHEEHCVQELLIIAAGLAVQDPRERPLDASQAADEKHKRYQDERSDFLSYLKLWQTYHEQAKQLSGTKLRRYCEEHYLSYRRLGDWHDVHGQLVEMAKNLGLTLNQQPGTYEQIHRAILSGLLANIAMKSEDQDYMGARGLKLMIFPGSALHKKRPAWLMAAEWVETARVYARTVANIDPLWVERLAPHLIKRSYSDPHWEKNQAAVVAYERVTLYGLPIVPRRKVYYGRIDGRESRAIFIRQALVAGDYVTTAEFFKHNQSLIREIEELEQRTRRQDLLADADTLYEFYERRVPEHVCDGRSFEHWRKEAEGREPKLLFLTRELLLQRDTGALAEQFPDTWPVNKAHLKLHYHFEPGHAEDGVTVEVPLTLLNQLRPETFEWLVPGLLREKIIALLKSLPQSLRRNFVPVPQFAEACGQALIAGDESLLDALARHLQKMTGVRVEREAWRLDDVPKHLLMNFKVIDEQGKVLAMGRDLYALRHRHEDRARQEFTAAATSALERDNIRAWDFGDLPEYVEIQRSGQTLRAYPALVYENRQIGLRLLDTREHAAAAMTLGLRQLFKLVLASQIKYLEKNLPELAQMCLQFATVGSCETLKHDIIDAVINEVFLTAPAALRTQAMFTQRLEAGRGQLVSAANALSKTVASILKEYHAVFVQLQGMTAVPYAKSVAEIKTHLGRLVYPGFVTATPGPWLAHVPRYLKAVQRRLDKLRVSPQRDLQCMEQIYGVQRLYKNYLDQQQRRGGVTASLQDFPWYLEELRVSLYAQELKTSLPVSVTRLEKMLREAR